MQPQTFYDPAQARDRTGKWTASGGGGDFRIANGAEHYKAIGIPRGQDSINATWIEKSWQGTTGEWYGDYRINDGELRAIHPDEPHNYQDHGWANGYERTHEAAQRVIANNKTISATDLMLDTSPDNPSGVNKQAMRYWSEPSKSARDKGGTGHQSYIQDGAARALGMTERGHNPQVLDKKTDAQYDAWGKNLLNGINAAPAAQPTLWRGIADREGSNVARLKALKPGAEFDVPLMSTSRDALRTSGYGSDVVLRIKPGSKGLANRDWFADDQEVITGGRFRVLRIDQADNTTVVSIEQTGTWSV